MILPLRATVGCSSSSGISSFASFNNSSKVNLLFLAESQITLHNKTFLPTVIKMKRRLHKDKCSGLILLFIYFLQIWNLMKINLTCTTDRHPVVVEVRQDLLGQVVTERQLRSVRIEGRSPSTPESFEPHRRRLQDRGERQPARLRCCRLLLQVGSFRHRVQVVRPDRLHPEPVWRSIN